MFTHRENLERRIGGYYDAERKTYYRQGGSDALVHNEHYLIFEPALWKKLKSTKPEYVETFLSDTNTIYSLRFLDTFPTEDHSDRILVDLRNFDVIQK